MPNKIKKKLLDFKKFFESRKSYSQEGEDLVLESILNLNKRKTKGFFVDIGAYHPVRFSNTYFFYKRGWKGINIDPTPGSMDLFNKFRKRDKNLNIGIGKEETTLDFYCFDEPALNSFDKKLSLERDKNTKFKIQKTTKVIIKPLAQVLDENISSDTIIDFFTIDVEGLDFQVLQSNNFDKYRPIVILVEDTQFNLKNLNTSELFNFLEEKGYTLLAKTPRTLFFKQKQ